MNIANMYSGWKQGGGRGEGGGREGGGRGREGGMYNNKIHTIPSM